MEIEIRVSCEEFHKIRKEKREIQKKFTSLEELERTLKLLEIKYLIEKRERLKKRLRDVESHYKMLLEFSEKAKRDKEKMKKLRLQLSLENRKLREEMKEYENCSKA
ncbi:hypothetical protein E3E31_09275 [Thermococcus sp. M39]|uniref:hypothetical protein n=1 Tax=unclassified Thermococcus TaxID=2627626 RepID=UPI00143CB103|nr:MULTISPECIES: hypothetical protein [unclassified Thermococcus]NJE08708.1 hypothetical protein [Thermococcus sp. M39]NJE12990.1 hypothetical protein [Thermococcus sp. LS2]